MIDVFGAVLTIIRDDAAVAAITPRVSSESQAAPCVQLIDNATTRNPFGPGSGRMGMQLWTGIARCWGPDTVTTDGTPNGAITARQLAGAVSDAIHNHRPTTVGTRYIARMYAPEIDGMNRDISLRQDQSRDLSTRRPFYDVRLDVYAAA